MKDDLFKVFQYCICSNSLPVSCKRAVISLLPKQGDLFDISNWRPVSLLNTDYKILAKVIANRLKSVISDVVRHDQCYAVPGRSIHDNLNVIRDSIMYANHLNIPLALCNHDQKKVFDCVDHEYYHTEKDGFQRFFCLNCPSLVSQHREHRESPILPHSSHSLTASHLPGLPPLWSAIFCSYQTPFPHH